MSDKHEHLDEGTIHAWLDGALPPDESARVETQARTCAECGALVAEAHGLVAASSRILSSLDLVPGGVIPGREGAVDQLAALRARHSATRRHWWSDRRIVAAASVLFVAGVSSVIWRSTANQPTTLNTELAAESSVVPDAAIPAPSAPSGATPVATREAPARDARAEAPAQVPAAPPVRVASARADSAVEQKVAGADMSLARGAALAANELRRADTSVIARSRQALDSMSVSARVTQSAVQERQLQQQGAAPQRQAFDQARVGAAPPALPLAAPRIADSIRQGRIVTTGVGAVATDAVISPIGCYELRFILDASGRIAAVSDTVRLLDDLVQRDDGWRLAQRVGGSRLAATAWRQVDSVTVELRTGVARDSSSVRFLWRGATVWQGGGQVLVRGAPDTTGLSGRRAALALRTVCP